MTHRQLEDIRLLQLADVLTLSLQIIPVLLGNLSILIAYNTHTHTHTRPRARARARSHTHFLENGLKKVKHTIDKRLYRHCIAQKIIILMYVQYYNRFSQSNFF